MDLPMTQAEKAKLLRDLHHTGHTLILPNAWDVASALIFEQAGFPAIATTSSGVAAVFGYPDGQHISRHLMIEMIGRIAAAVSVPVTGDVEGGYEDPVQTAIEVMNSGAAGMNIEDRHPNDRHRLLDIAHQAEVISAIRARTNLVINARTDVYLAGIGDPGARFDHTVERLHAYREAGADSLFVPGLADPGAIARLVRAAGAPLNILATKGCPPIAELQKLGVARVTVGSGIMRAALGLARTVATELAGEGTYNALTEGALNSAELQSMLAKKTANATR